MRDLRTVNMTYGQQVEPDKVLKRIGDISYRDMGVLLKIACNFNSGKSLFVEGIRVEPSSGMTVNVTQGMLLQRIGSSDVLPVVMVEDETVAMDAASGVVRVDMIEGRVLAVEDKDDTGLAVLDSSTGDITIESIKRDIKYYLQLQKKTGSTAVTAGTAGILTGTVSIPGTIDLSLRYLINLADGEDGSFQEIDLRGVDPTATTRAEIINLINTAVGRTIASSSGNYVVLTGEGLGKASRFEIKNPVSNADADAMDTVFGVLGTGVYEQVYEGEDEWFKIAEIDIDTVSTVITTAMIRDVSQRSTWASESENTMLKYEEYNSDWPVSTTFFREKTILKILQESVNSGSLFPDNTIVSTYSGGLSSNNTGGILDVNGDLHAMFNTPVYGQKINILSGTISTYSLVYSTGTDVFRGGVLSLNGDIHFIPYAAIVGQKVDVNSIASTYSLIYTTGGAYYGGVLSPNGDIHMIPYNASVGQKINSAGVVSTYALVYTVAQAYSGGVLSPNGDIHFVPHYASVGQKINSAGVVSTYSLVYTTPGAYMGGVLASNGDIHFVPHYAVVGQKISSAGVVSTYSLIYTTTDAYAGGVLAPNGDIHFVPLGASVGQKINAAGVVSTYSLAYTTSGAGYIGGVLLPNGDIYFMSTGITNNQKISTLPFKPFSKAMCCSPYLNKF
jgi:hypothetical protein